MISLTVVIQFELCQTQHHIWQGSLSSVSMIAPRLITVCRWRTNGHWKCLHSILLAELLLTENSHINFSRSVFDFQSFMSEYWDPVVKADQCAQYVDDIGIATNIATHLTPNIQAVFQCICQAGLKLKIEKCNFGVRQVEFLGRTIPSEGVSPQTHKLQKFLNQLRLPKWERVFAALFGVH